MAYTIDALGACLMMDQAVAACGEPGMKIHLYLLAIAVLLSTTRDAPASERRPLREAHSENGRFHLRIHAGRPARNESDRCRAILYERGGERKRDRRVWRVKLANEVAPCRALIRNDGRFVVMLDEFRRGGGAHAVVIYGEHGKQLREFDLRELLHGDDWKHVTVERRAVEWLPDATFAFVDKPPLFVIKLKWGREIRVDLEKLETVGKGVKPGETLGEAESNATSKPTANDAIPPEILALLKQPTSAAADNAEGSSDPITEAVLRALAKLQRLAETSGVDVDVAGIVAAAGLEDAVAALQKASTAGADISQQPRYAGNSAAAGLAVPLPNPANPVDYVAWVVELTETDGPSAVPLYKDAIKKRVPWEGNDDLYEAARRGDPEALASPEVIEWLEANEEALADFRAAPWFEYRGMVEAGDDYSVIGILLPNLSDRRRLFRTSIIDAKYLEANGDVGSALGNYLDNLAIGAQTSQGPMLIENLVGIAMQAETADDLLDCFASPCGDEINYVRLARELEDSFQPLRPIVECFQGERALAFDIIQHIYEWDEETGQYRVAGDADKYLDKSFGITSEEFGFSVVLGAIGFERMVELTNEWYDELTRASMLPYPEAKEALSEFDEHARSTTFKLRYPLLSVILPSLGRANHLATRSATTRNATRVIANLKAYRQQYGEYPDSLDVFGDAEMVIDPFTDHSFAYRREGDDFTLYSLGGNGIDDGGVHDRRANTNDVLYWPRPPKE